MQPGWISVALAAFTVASLASGEQGPVQPIYHGRTLTEWVNIGLGPYSGASVDEAKEAVQQIGTNALPFAIQWFQTKPVCLRPRTDTIGDAHVGATRIITNAEPFWIALDRALWVFRVLGDHGSNAVPQLVELVNSPDNVLVDRVLDALACVGEAGVPALLGALQDPEGPNRVRIVRILRKTPVSSSSPGSAATVDLNLFAPALVDCLLQQKDTDLEVEAARTLSRLHLQPAVAVPALVNALASPQPVVRRSAVEALLEYGADARPALSALQEHLDDIDLSVRAEVQQALEVLTWEE